MTTTTTTFTRNTMVQRIAESIFERLPAEDAPKFFAALPGAIGCDGKDLSCVGWKFLAQTLRNMPRQLPEIQEVVDQVIDGLELLAAGGQWPADAADDAADAADAAVYSSISVQWVADAADDAADAADAAVYSSISVQWVADAAGYAAAAASADARRQWAADAAASACWANACAPAAACWADAAVAEAAAAADAASASAFAAACCADADAAAAVAQQRDLLLQLLTNAPVLEGSA